MAKRPKNDFTTVEQRLLRELYPTHMPIEEIARRMPRHTVSSIEQHALKTLKLHRPVWIGRPAPGWERVRDLLKSEPLTLQAVADRLGISKARVHQYVREHRSELYIADWEPPVGKGTWSMIWAYGDKDDAPRRSKLRDAINARLTKNPFLAAAGLVSAPAGQPGRVYQHLVDDDEREAA